jgi:TldD protein
MRESAVYDRPFFRSYASAVICVPLLLILSSVSRAATDGMTPPVLDAMQAELDRSMQKLKSQPVPPYFLSYEITESHNVFVIGTFGKLTNSVENRQRQLDIDLRVGDYSMDNTREIRGGIPQNPYANYSNITIPIDNDPDAIRGVLWYHTDERYKRALEEFTKVKTNNQVKVAQEDQSTDFSHEEGRHFSEPPVEIKIDRKIWEDKVRKYSAPFAQYTKIYQATAFLSAGVETRWYVNNEGARIQTSQPAWRLMLIAYTKADDGMELPLYESFFGFTEKDLPDDATVLKSVNKMIRNLEALRVAPLTDPYTGPAILSGRASGVFFHEIFGHRVEGHRQKLANESQTFKKKINELVLSKDFSVSFDPTMRRMADTDLSGYFRYDNQGVEARRVKVVENGILKTFLMSRSPIDGIPQSNGHGRKQVGLSPVARQSNLIVEVAPAAVKPDLKKLLIEEVKKQGLPFGLYFEDIQGGFTFTGRTTPNAFNVLPLVVYRIYTDGHEELVRGVDLIGTPLTTFSKIAAADKNVEVFNGICGAESGGVPVSAVSPGILVSQIEVQKKQKSQDRQPILPAPFQDK